MVNYLNGYMEKEYGLINKVTKLPMIKNPITNNSYR